MVYLGYNTGVNRIKSDGLLAQHRHPFSTYVRGIDTMSDITPTQEQTQEIPYGYCHCGCGRKTTIAKRNYHSNGGVKGQPVRFIHGHSRVPPRTVLADDLALPPGARAIPLTLGQFAIVDAADYEWLMQWRWCAEKRADRRDYGRIVTYYAYRLVTMPDGRGIRISMHQEICCKGTDHKDGNGLNNTRNNLRPATIQQNTQNCRPFYGSTSKFKGVSWSKYAGKWQASIKTNGKSKYLGYFVDEVEAARAYDAAAKELFGVFAWLNFEVAP